MTVHEAISRAAALLPGEPAAEGEEDPRWQAIIAVGGFIETHPEEVWAFVARWGRHEQDDLRMAVATCLLEHLLEHRFDLIFPRVELLARRDPLFAETFCACWKFGQSRQRQHAERFDRLQAEILGRPG
jgi:hypothetical protein